MGMGYGANFAHIVEDQDLQNICTETYQALMTALQENNQTLEELAEAIEYDEFNDQTFNQSIISAKVRLFHDFRQKTNLEINLGYHDQDEQGDRYDDIDGHYWYMDAVDFTPDAKSAMKKYNFQIKTVTYVTFG